MVKKVNGSETMRSLEQKLTFTEAEKTFQKYGVEFNEEKYIALGLVGKNDGLYTNLALLVSDQCRQTTKIAVFQDEAKTIFKDNKEFSGSIFKQLAEAFQYLMLCNNTHAEVHGLERIERQDYPEEAMREALLNALVHRDYSFSGSIIINVTDTAMEFISLGGLMPGFTKDDILSGISLPRNQKLAEIFHRLRLIEAYGTGIRRIYSFYKDAPVQPSIELTPNTFKMILPNINSNTMRPSVTGRKQLSNEQFQAVYEYLLKYQQISEQEVQKLLHVKSTRAYTVMRQMKELNLVQAIGRGADKKYVLK